MGVVLGACGSPESPSPVSVSSAGAGAGGAGSGGSSAGGTGAASSGQAGQGPMLGAGAMWSALPAGDGERATQRKAACVAQCRTDGGCGFWDAADCERQCADPRLGCQADLAPAACWDKMVAFESCKATLSCAQLNQFYYHATEGARPCQAATDELGAACGFVELVASEQCYGPSLRCADGSDLSPYWVCDGDNDCAEGADEGNCPWLSSGAVSSCLASATIDGEDSAGDIAALAGVTCIRGALNVSGSTLADLSGLESLTTVGELRIGVAPPLSFDDAGNPSLVSLHGLENLKGVGAVRIEDNPALTDLQALSGLTFVTGDVDIIGNAALASLEGLHNLTRAGEMELSNNASLTSLNGLRGLTAVDGLSLRHDPLLVNFEGLGSLEYFGAMGLSVDDNAALVDFSGLQIRSIGASFDVSNNAVLTSLKGLEGVTLLAWTVTIRKNPLLASIGALAAVTELRGDVTISENPLLPACAIEGFLTPLGKTCTCSGNGAAACP